MTFEDYIDDLVESKGEAVAFWHMCNIKSAFYHKYGRYPPTEEEYVRFADSLIGTTSTPNKTIMCVYNNTQKTEHTKSPFNKIYKIWK